MRPLLPTILAAMALAAAPLAAQLQLPRVPGVGGIVGNVTGTVDDTLETADRLTAREARRLLRVRDQTLARLLRQNSDVIERDVRGELARRGELLAIEASAAQIAQLEAAGFRVLGRERIEGLDIAVTRLGIQSGQSLAQAQARAAAIVPELELGADNLHFAAGTVVAASTSAPLAVSLAAAQAAPITVPIGIIDGAPGNAVPVAAIKGFAEGAPTASDHGSAVASLLRATGVRTIRVADVYGQEPAGGNALAISKALGWLSASGCKVVTISLVGPRNPLVERAIKAARERGIIIVAAVGNDGPAAPAAYPASYDGVLAITGADRKGRALIEAGRALHLDYAAPGADVYAFDAKGRSKLWRGTSFATPLAAARVAAALSNGQRWRAALDTEARDLGAKGADKVFGRGLLCGGCGKK
ncbi:S8 family serine peptidase [Erythrobacter donghaensis]|uniref:S8 family serine peptidase n=1 Tax=Erythrobacter donghaensis TaxID=267135 RepID=UPI001FEC10FE|nr:S8 family serine peptidase [Erythrobacter donghaensis]